jgi:uncharacterized protein (TIGR02246 family)
MHPRLRFAPALLAALFATATMPAQQPVSNPGFDPQAIEKAVRETNARMTEAANRLDADAFFDFILETDKGLIIQNGTIFKNRQEALDAVKRGFQGIAKMDRRLENPQVTVISADLALLVAEGNTVATFASGQTTTSHFAVSLIFMRKEGQWKLLHGHYSMPANRT